MDRRSAIQTGLLGSGALFLGQAASAEELKSELVPQLSETPPRAGSPAPGPDLIRFDTHEIIENEINFESKGSENWGQVGPGIHAREFDIPEDTHLILGQVQEDSNYGEAKYETMGISINRRVWRCRVIWRMTWNVGGKLNTRFNWVRY